MTSWCFFYFLILSWLQCLHLKINKISHDPHLYTKPWQGTSRLPHNWRTSRSHIRGFHNTHNELTHQRRIQLPFDYWRKKKKSLKWGNESWKHPKREQGLHVGVCDRQTQWCDLFWGPEKNKAAVSALCVWCGRDSVCQIPFPLAKEKLPSPTHTPDVLPTSASWDTHTFGFPSPCHCTHPRSCKLRDSKQIFPWPKMAVGHRALLIRRDVKSVAAVCRLRLLASPGREKQRIFKELIRGRLLRPTSHHSQRLSYVRSHFEHGYMSWQKGFQGYDSWPSHKYNVFEGMLFKIIKKNIVLIWYHVKKNGKYFSTCFLEYHVNRAIWIR